VYLKLGEFAIQAGTVTVKIEFIRSIGRFERQNESLKLWTMTTTLPAWLADANRDFARKFPGESGERQPVHAVYGGAHLFKADTCQKFGTLAEKAVREYAPDGAAFAEVNGGNEEHADRPQASLRKLARTRAPTWADRSG